MYPSREILRSKFRTLLGRVFQKEKISDSKAFHLTMADSMEKYLQFMLTKTAAMGLVMNAPTEMDKITQNRTD